MADKNYRSLWTLALVCALCARIGVAAYWSRFVADRAARESVENDGDGPFFFGDSDSYWKLARAVAFRRPYQFDEERRWQVFRSPGYPAILAPLFLIYGERPPVAAARALGVGFGVVNVALVGILALSFCGRNARGRKTAIVSMFVVALDPSLCLQSACVLSEEPFLTFALLLDLSILKSARRFSLIAYPKDDSTLRLAQSDLKTKTLVCDAATLALCNAATIYIRPSWFYFLPCAFAFLIAANLLAPRASHMNEKKERTTPAALRARIVKGAAFAILVALLTTIALSPWTLRNLRLTGRPIATTLQMGASLYDGLNPSATGASDMTFVDDFRREETLHPSASEDVHFEIRLDERMKRAAIDWTKRHPLDVARLACVKTFRLWSPIPREPAFSKPLFQLVLAASFAPVFILGIAGGVLAWRRRESTILLLATPLYVGALHAVFVSSIRYRAPALPCFAILAAALCVRLWSARKRQISRRERQQTVKK